MAMASSSVDSATLVAEGLAVPAGANVFAARIVDGGPSPAYMLYEAGGGAFTSEFSPASSIKELAVLGALELAYSAGFTGPSLTASSLFPSTTTRRFALPRTRTTTHSCVSPGSLG